MASKELQLELSHFEGDGMAVCLDDDGREYQISESLIPTEVKEGDEFKVKIETID